MLVILLLGSVVAHAEQGAKPKLTIYWMSIFAENSNQEFSAQVQQWGQANGVDVAVENISQKDLDYKLAIAAEKGTGADIAILPAAAPVLYSHVLVDVSDVVRDVEREQGADPFWPSAAAQARVGKQWKAIPYYGHAHTFVVLKGAFDKAGIPFPDTWDQVIEYGLKLQQVGHRYPFGQSLTRSYDGIQFWNSIWWSYGGHLVKEDGTTLTFDSPETRKVLNLVVDMYRKYRLIPPGATGWDDAANNTIWMTGQLAMTTNAPSVYYAAKRQRPDIAEQTFHIKFPARPVGRAAYATAFSVGIFRETRYPEQAKSLLRHLFRPENYRRFMVAAEGAISPMVRSFMSDPLWSDPHLAGAVEQMPFVLYPGWPGPVTRQAAEVLNQRVMIDMVSRVVAENLTPEASLSEALQRIKAIYGEK